MERWGANKGAAPDPGRARRYADQPSFSSTLLDAIYRSMDEPDDGAAARNAKKRDEALLHYKASSSLAGSYRAAGSRVTASSSSDCSSYGGFSSSEAGSSAQQQHQHHRRLRPVRTSVEAGAPPVVAQEKKAVGKPGAAKLRDLRIKPASPGARLAGFLNSVFSGKRGPASPSASSRAAEDQSACSTASSSSSYSRSCLSKTPSTRGGAGGQPKRTVRFLDRDDGVEAPTSSVVVERRSRVQVGVADLEQMLLRRMEMESDDDDDDESSDASSDLFELENLAAIDPTAGAYRDELPVYETTTRVVLNHRGIGHGHGRRSTRVV